MQALELLKVHFLGFYVATDIYILYSENIYLL